jgi:hypothetical protein
MAVKVGSFNVSTAAATTEVEVTDVGFTPTGVIFWWSGRTEAADTSGGANIRSGIGVAQSSTSRYCIDTTLNDAAGGGAHGTVTSYWNNSCINLNNDNTNPREGAMDFVDFSPSTGTGFTLVIDVQFGADLRVHYMAFDDPSVACGEITPTAATGEQDFTGVGFQPECVVFFGGNVSAVNNAVTSQGAALHMGFATGASNEATVGVVHRELGTNSTAHRYGYEGECFTRLDRNGAPEDRYELSQFLSDGFKLNKLEATNAWPVVYLALAGGAGYHVGSLTTATNTSNFSETGVGGTPEGVLFVSHCTAQSTQDTQDDHWKFSIGAGTSDTETVAHASSSQDGLTADSETFTAIDFDAVYIRPDLADGVEGVMDLVSMDSDGFTVVMDDADPDAAFVAYLALGVTPAGANLGGLVGSGGLAGPSGLAGLGGGLVG